MKGKNAILNLVLAANFMTLGLVLPFLTGQVPEIGQRLCPMHIPILLCGYVCGWPWGLAVGFFTPLLRSLIFGMPMMMPNAVAMAFELAVYGCMTGFLYAKLPKKTWSIYAGLIAAMIAGRVVWGLVSVPIRGLASKPYSFNIFITGAIVDAIPGIILQIILVPAIVIALKRAGVMNRENN